MPDETEIRLEVVPGSRWSWTYNDEDDVLMVEIPGPRTIEDGESLKLPIIGIYESIRSLHEKKGKSD